MLCEKHNSSEVLFYCKTCEEPLCADAIVDDTAHRQHEYFKLSKVYGEAKERVRLLMERYSDLKSDCQQEIAKYQKQMLDERRKNEIKLSEFMKEVDEKLQ